MQSAVKMEALRRICQAGGSYYFNFADPVGKNSDLKSCGQACLQSRLKI
jgi:hypothetical protein